MTDAEMIAALRSLDPNQVAAALAELLPGQKAMLFAIREAPTAAGVFAVHGMPAPTEAFVHLLTLCQQVGEACGLALHWTPNQRTPRPGHLLLPTGKPGQFS